MDLNLRHLRAIASVVRFGTLSAAARQVAVTQPALTQAIGKVERQVGMPLFARSSEGMAATQAAALLAPRIEAALAHIGSQRVTAAQMRAFIATADAGSYSAASAATGLSQPSLHRAIHDLSIALRRPLVVRSGRGIALTGGGRRTARAFRLARAEIAAGLSEVAALAGRETGRITIGAMPLSRAALLPAAVTAFHRAQPDATIAIVEGSRAELIEPLRDGSIDLLIGALREPPDPDLAQTALFADRPVIISRSGHPLAGTAPDMGALAAYPWTVAAPGTPLRRQWERMFEDAGVAPPPVRIECGSVIAIRQILRDSEFLTLLSVEQLAAELDLGWLTVVRDAPPSLKRVIGMTTRADWRPTALQAAFLGTVRETARLQQN